MIRKNIYCHCLIATLVLCGFLAPRTEAAIIAHVNIDTPNQLSIELSGSLDGPSPPKYPNSISLKLGTSLVEENILPISVSGSGFNGASGIGVLYNNSNTTTDSIGIVELWPLGVGDSISGSASFIYANPHNIAAGDPFDLYWGSEFNVPAQSSGIIGIPEPSSISFISVACGCIYIFRKRLRK